MERRRNFEGMALEERILVDGRYAMDTFKRSPTEYRALVRKSGLPPSARESYVLKYGPKPTHVPTDYELLATRTFSKEDVQRAYRDESKGSKDNPGTLAAKDPERYRLLRTAAILHGVVTPDAESLPMMPAPALNEPATITPPPEIDKFFNLDGKKITTSGLVKLTAAKAEFEAREQREKAQAEFDTQLKASGLQRNSDGTFSKIA